MIDWDAEVLAPCVEIFARPILVTPVVSQPGDLTAVPPVPAGLPYLARGVWTSRPIDVQTEVGIMSSQENGLGIRALDFPIPPAPGDLVDISAAGSLPAVGRVAIEDTDEDGQGGIFLSIKTLDP